MSEKAEIIKALREKTGQSQSQFAERFGIPVRTLQQWEQGRSEPPVYVFSIMKSLLEAEDALAEMASAYSAVPVTINYSIPRRTRWKVCVKEPFLNCDRIYPIQQRKVQALIKDASRDSSVKKMIVFGSSVTDACHIGSDVDIYAEMDSDHNPLKSSYDFEYDFWNNYNVDDRIKKEIEAKGICVYVRTKNLI